MIILVINMDECVFFFNVEYIIKYDYIVDICRFISVFLSKYIIMFIILLYMNILMIDIN